MFRFKLHAFPTLLLRICLKHESNSCIHTITDELSRPCSIIQYREWNANAKENIGYRGINRAIFEIFRAFTDFSRYLAIYFFFIPFLYKNFWHLGWKKKEGFYRELLNVACLLIGNSHNLSHNIDNLQNFDRTRSQVSGSRYNDFRAAIRSYPWRRIGRRLF